MTMIEKSYQNVETRPLSASQEKVTAHLIAEIKEVILSYGFAQQAVDNLLLTVTEHTLNITPAERQTGAFHVYDGGEPFYALTLSSDKASPFCLMNADIKQPTKMSIEEQTAFIAFELGMNLFPKIEKAVKVLYPALHNPSSVESGIGSEIMSIHTELCSRQSPIFMLNALRQLTNIRLTQVVPQRAAPTPKKNSGGPKF